MRLWLRRQKGCIFYVSSNVSEYQMPTYLRFILRSLGLSLNTVVQCGIMPSPSNYQIASSECRNGRCASSFLYCYQEALATTGCVSLHTKKMELCSKLLTKIKEPESRLCHLVPPTRSQVQSHSFRNKDRPSLISCKTERFKRSFFPAMCLYAHGM